MQNVFKSKPIKESCPSIPHPERAWLFTQQEKTLWKKKTPFSSSCSSFLCSAELVLDIHQAVVGLGSFGVYELAFLLFGVQEVAQVEDDWEEEHKAGHSNDWHGLLTWDRAAIIFTPQTSSHVHSIFYINAVTLVFQHGTVHLIKSFVCGLAVHAQLSVVLLVLLKAAQGLVQVRNKVQGTVGQTLLIWSQTLGAQR